ncbi:MAG: DUF4105 domain-containing protein [Myxococcota bacterium]
MTAAAGAIVLELLTFGIGSDPFSHFGHAAICVREPERDRCFNFGTADFSTPVPLTLGFLRGQADFWVSVVDRKRTLDWYASEDRTIESQALTSLTATEARDLAALLEASAAPDVRFYRYNHFADNCTTRIRDLLDRATQGRLRAATFDRPSGRSFRDYVEQGFADDLLLLMLSQVMVGRAVDRPATTWEALFLPAELRDAVERVYGAEPVALFRSSHHQTPLGFPRGSLAILGLGVLGALLVSMSARTKRPRLGAAIALACPILLGLLIDAVAAYSIQPELRVNEALLVLSPLDVLALHRGAGGLAWRRFRLGMLGLLLILKASGVLLQPLWAPIAALALVLLSLEVSWRAFAKSE